MAVFLIWIIVGIFFIGMGIGMEFVNKRAKKTVPFGFWANAEVIPVTNVKAYNRALSKLWCVFGMVFVFLGIPLFAGQNSPYIIVSILGAAFEVIVTMAVYSIKIEEKYKKESNDG